MAADNVPDWAAIGGVVMERLDVMERGMEALRKNQHDLRNDIHGGQLIHAVEFAKIHEQMKVIPEIRVDVKSLGAELEHHVETMTAALHALGIKQMWMLGVAGGAIFVGTIIVRHLGW